MVIPPANETGWQQDAERVRLEFELTRQMGPGVDPDKAPRHQPGDEWIIFGMIGGALVGGGLGAVIGLLLDNLSVVTGLVAGLLIGTLAGAFAGERVKKHLANLHSSGRLEPPRSV